jgi:hypothetical protein
MPIAGMPVRGRGKIERQGIERAPGLLDDALPPDAGPRCGAFDSGCELWIVV